MYGTTESKLTHLIKDHPGNGDCGYWLTACGKWIRPRSVSREKDTGCRMCKACAKKEGA